MIELPPAFKYQEYERDKIIARKRTAVIAPPGSGKTRPIIEAVNELGGFNKAVLVVCSGPAIPTWIRQIPLWGRCPEYSDNIYVVRGNKDDRIDLWRQAAREEYGTYITNFAIFYRDYDWIKAAGWRVVIADEYHKTMRSPKIHIKKTGRKKTYGRFKQMTRHTEILVLATGSLVRRNASSMFTAFQLVDPFVWSSYWKYVNMFCFVDDTPFGKEIHGVKNAQNLRDAMDKYFAYVPPEVCADSLPEGRRYPIRVDITKEQKRIYKDIDEDMMAIVGDSVIVTSTILAKITKLRQLLCCPKILDPSLGMGAGYETILDKLDEDPHVVIFVPFRPACDFIKTDLQEHGYQHVYIMRGGMTEEEIERTRLVFARMRGIIVCTIAYAESFDLDTCKTSYFLGYDMAVDQNEQAEGRTRRAVSEHEFVTWGYIKTTTPVDQHFLAKLGEDSRNAALILQRPDEFIQKLLQETRQ